MRQVAQFFPIAFYHHFYKFHVTRAGGVFFCVERHGVHGKLCQKRVGKKAKLGPQTEYYDLQTFYYRNVVEDMSNSLTGKW